LKYIAYFSHMARFDHKVNNFPGTFKESGASRAIVNNGCFKIMLFMQNLISAYLRTNTRSVP
jgi:hypothetical protein